METYSVPRWSLLLTVLFMLIVQAGCSDMLSSNDAELKSQDKLRLGDMVNIESESEDDDDNDNDNDDDDDDDDDNGGSGGINYTHSYKTQYLLGLNEPVLTADRLLKRYNLLTGYRLLKRYDGSQEVFYGIVGEFESDDFESEDEFEFSLDELLDELEYDNDVRWIEPDIVLYDPVFVSHYEVNNHQVTPWNIDHVGRVSGDVSGVDVYLLDSGIYSNDLNVVEEIDYVGDSESVAGKTHGYHIAGTIGALDNQSGVVGVRIHSFRVLDNAGETKTSIVVTALDEIISRKRANPSQPMVVNMSFGVNTGTSEYNVLDEAVEAAVAAGIVVVVSAGNEGVDASTVTPAHAESAITVGAFGANDTFSAFSNYGTIVDILAPGEDILSSIGIEGAGTIQLSSRSGTSMAAPHVAGVAVAYLQANPAATPAEVRDALVNSASAMVSSVPSGTTNRAVKVQ